LEANVLIAFIKGWELIFMRHAAEVRRRQDDYIGDMVHSDAMLIERARSTPAPSALVYLGEGDTLRGKQKILPQKIAELKKAALRSNVNFREEYWTETENRAEREKRAKLAEIKEVDWEIDELKRQIEELEDKHGPYGDEVVTRPISAITSQSNVTMPVARPPSRLVLGPALWN
jgi:hypothetical protein